MNLTYHIPSSNRNVNVELQNGRAVISSSSTSIIKEEVLKCLGNTDKKTIFLKSISYEDQVTFKVGDTLTFKLDKIISQFKIEEIIKTKVPGTYCFIYSRNSTSLFLLPLIYKYDRNNPDYFGWRSFMINAYISDNLKELIVVSRFFPGESYLAYESYLKTQTNYTGFIDINYYLVGYRFHIDPIFGNDVKLFISGKYSKFSDEAKRKILLFHKLFGNKDYLTWTNNILYKEETRAKEIAKTFGLSKLDDNIELLSIPNPMNEFYNLKYDSN